MKSPYERAMSRVEKLPGGCWLYQGSRDPQGYGTVSTRRGQSPAKVHRVVYEDRVGPIPKGLVLRHSCDNPACCNPDHLTPGTQRENVLDAVKRHRLNPRSRLNLRPGAKGCHGAGPVSVGEMRRG